MSTTEAANLQAQFEPAMANIMAHVYRPHFFAKLASLGIVPKDAEEADSLVDLGLKLAEMNAPVPTEKSAAAGQPAKGHNKYAEAYESLNRLRFTSEELAAQQRKSAAAQLAADPAIYASAYIVRACDQQAVA